jgi:endo-1,4-beta-xylanase
MPTRTQDVLHGTPDALPTPTEDTWAPLPGSPDLSDDPSWACLGVRTGNAIAFEASSGYRTVINTNGPVIGFDDDVGVAADIEIARGSWGAFVLYGALAQGAWWEGIRRLDLEWRQGELVAIYWDGTQDSPSEVRTFGAESHASRVKVGVRKQDAQLLLLVDDVQVGQIDDPGVFPNGKVYLGTNVPTNSTLIVREILVEAPAGKETSVQVTSTMDASAYSPTSPSLRELAAERGITIGAAVSADPLRCDPAYPAALAHEFSTLTAENALKFGPVHPEPERYTFDDADAIVAFAREHDMGVRGHTLVWHEQLAAWVEEGSWTRDELLEVLHDHIETVVGRYRGSVDVWDVVNEAVTDAGDLRDTVWLRTIGPEYIDLAFQWAHEADPDALLFYNDYGAEGINMKSDAIYALVKDMRERGVPVHGVGLQAHLSVGTPLQADELTQNIARLGDLGLQVHITELDVRLPGDDVALFLAGQAEVYRTIMDACLAADNCTSFVTWGVTDRYSWIPRQHPGYGSALLLDESYSPKPAYDALRDALAAP